MKNMNKKFLLAGIMAGVMVLGAVPALAATHDNAKHHGQQISRDTNNGQHQGKHPQMRNGEQPPEPPKDENGNPLPPPDGKGMQGQNGSQPPEPPKDENGKTLSPPDGSHHGQQKENKR